MITAAIVILTLLVPELHGNFVTLFTPIEYRYTGGKYHEQEFGYRLFIPELSSDTPKFPLIVWLHGYGEAGHDNFAHLRWIDRLILQPPWEKSRYPFFVLAVQCPHDNASWSRLGKESAGDDMVDVTYAIIVRVLAKYPVDRERICVTGLSSGGNGCWELAARHRDVFAAVAPMASSGPSANVIEQLAGIPIWAFNSNGDTSAPIDMVRSRVAALQQAGGNVHLTGIESTDHDCWRAAFDDYDLLNWLLSQKKNDPRNPPPGVSSWYHLRTEILAAGGTIVLVGIIWFVLRRRNSVLRQRVR